MLNNIWHYYYRDKKSNRHNEKMFLNRKCCLLVLFRKINLKHCNHTFRFTHTEIIMNSKLQIPLLFCVFFTVQSFAQSFLVGPMLHYNIGSKEKNHFSFAVEASLWSKGPYYNYFDAKSIDLGFEFEGEKVRVYSELQCGFVIGTSLGYVQEYYKGLSKGGFQGSVWGAVFGGLDLRYRYINDIHYFSPGTFIKLPLMSDFIQNLRIQ